MRIVVTLDVMLARRKMKAKDLAERVGITEANLSLLRTGKVKGVRFETLAKICEALSASRRICWISKRARVGEGVLHADVRSTAATAADLGCRHGLSPGSDSRLAGSCVRERD